MGTAETIILDRSPRWGRRVLLSTAVALPITWLSAWGLALWSPPYTNRLPPSDGWLGAVGPYWPDAPTSWGGERGVGFEWRTQFREAKYGFDGLRSEPLRVERTVRAGWPCYAMWVRRTEVNGFELEGRHWHPPGSLRPPAWLHPDDTTRFTRVLPYQPLVLGFSLNTLTFAIVIMVFTILLPWLRLRRREALGLCRSCAHALVGASICPECGRANR